MATQSKSTRGGNGSADKRPRVLRIGIIQGGRIVEERLVKKRENITLGQSAKNMFVVPSEALPRQWLLFEITSRGYVAHFADGMDARIAVGNEVISLSQLKQAGKLKKSGGAWLLTLDERSRGKLTVGDLTVLFQFVAAPPERPKPQLPASVRGSFTSNLDWAFTGITSVSFFITLALIVYIRSIDFPEEPAIDEVPDRFVKMVVKRKEQQEEAKKKEEAKKPKEKVKKPKKVAKKKKKKVEEPEKVAEEKPKEKAPKKQLSEAEKRAQAEARAKAAAERRARLQEEVQNIAIVKILGSKRDAVGSVADVLRRGDVDRDQEEAFKNVGGLKVASAKSLRGVRKVTKGTGKVAKISGLRASGSGIKAGKTGGKAKERKVKGVVKTQAPDIDGELDLSVVSRQVRARMSAIRLCYERALKRNPSLGGKLVLFWTITQAGTVSGIEVEQDTLRDSQVTSCIKGLVARWRFPKPSAGSVDVAYPFVFAASK